MGHHDGKIIAAQCKCMSGLAESCSHVGALLFAIEAAVKIRNSARVTQSKAYWLLHSGVNKVDYLEVKGINFASVKTRKKQLDWCLTTGDSPPTPTTPELHSFIPAVEHIWIKTSHPVFDSRVCSPICAKVAV